MCRRAPYKDAFHCSKRIVDSTQPHHELSQLFCQLVSQCFLQYDESSAIHVAKLYMQKSKQKLAPEIAKDRALQSPEYRKKIKNYAPKRDSQAAALEEAYKRIEKVDQDKKAEATLLGEPYMPLILSSKKGVRVGTRKELDNMLKHVRRGCCVKTQLD